MEIAIIIIFCVFGLSTLYYIIKIILDEIKAYKERHHNKKMSLCKNCKYNRERARKMYNYNRYTQEKYCSLKECMHDKKEV